MEPHRIILQCLLASIVLFGVSHGAIRDRANEEVDSIAKRAKEVVLTPMASIGEMASNMLPHGSLPMATQLVPPISDVAHQAIPMSSTQQQSSQTASEVASEKDRNRRVREAEARGINSSSEDSSYSNRVRERHHQKQRFPIDRMQNRDHRMLWRGDNHYDTQAEAAAYQQYVDDLNDRRFDVVSNIGDRLSSRRDEERRMLHRVAELLQKRNNERLQEGLSKMSPEDFAEMLEAAQEKKSEKGIFKGRHLQEEPVDYDGVDAAVDVNKIASEQLLRYVAKAAANAANADKQPPPSQPRRSSEDVSSVESVPSMSSEAMHTGGASATEFADRCYKMQSFTSSTGEVVTANVPCEFAYKYKSDYVSTSASSASNIDMGDYPHDSPHHEESSRWGGRSSRQAGILPNKSLFADSPLFGGRQQQSYQLSPGVEDQLRLYGLNSLDDIPPHELEALFSQTSAAELDHLMNNASSEDIAHFLSSLGIEPVHGAEGPADTAPYADPMMGYASVPHSSAIYSSMGYPYTSSPYMAHESIDPTGLTGKCSISDICQSLCGTRMSSIAGGHCSPESGIEAFLESLNARERRQLRKYLRDMGFYDSRFDALGRNNKKDRFDWERRERSGLRSTRSRKPSCVSPSGTCSSYACGAHEDKRDWLNLREREPRNRRFSLGPHACPRGRVRIRSKCKRVRSPVQRCSGSKMLQRSPTCQPEAVSDLICGEGFNLTGSKCNLEFDPLLNCPHGTLMLSGKCLPDMQETSTMTTSLSSSPFYNSAADFGCPLDTVNYVDQCVPATGRKGIRGRKLLGATKNVVSTCPTGFVPISEITSAVSLNSNYRGTDGVCAKIVEADISCPDGYEMVPKTNKSSASSQPSMISTVASESICQKVTRRTVGSSRCQNGLTLNADGTECVGKKRVAFDRMCERGRLDGNRCVDHSQEAPSMSCPEGTHVEVDEITRQAICVKSGRGRHLLGNSDLLPLFKCRSAPNVRKKGNQCIRETYHAPTMKCGGGGVVDRQSGDCMRHVRERPQRLCLDNFGKHTSQCVEHDEKPVRHNCPNRTEDLCFNGDQGKRICPGMCLERSRPAVSRRVASGRRLSELEQSRLLTEGCAFSDSCANTSNPLGFGDEGDLSRRLGELSEQTPDLMFCPVGSELVSGGEEDSDYCVVETAPMVPNGCGYPGAGCPGSAGEALCPEGYEMAAEGRLCVEAA